MQFHEDECQAREPRDVSVVLEKAFNSRRLQFFPR